MCEDNKKVCNHCCSEYVPMRSDQKFCSPRCRYQSADAVLERIARRKRLRDSRLKFIRRVKTFYGCASCGYKGHFSALQFDHIDPASKSFELAKGHTRSMEQIKEEIKKCRILCANCHSIHTFNQGKEAAYANEKT